MKKSLYMWVEILKNLIVKTIKKTLKAKSLSLLTQLNITEGPKDFSKKMDKYLYGSQHS